MATPEQGYKDHKPGSRKGVIHQLFDEEGDDTAWTRGKREGLKESTLRGWFAAWRSEKPKLKRATPKANAKDPAPEASAPQATI